MSNSVSSIHPLNEINKKLKELMHRINFFKASMDHDKLIGTIERELTSIAEFQCTFYKYNSAWAYDIICSVRHSHNYECSLPMSMSKLDSLYYAIKDLARDE